jgi:Carboxypeptidase regulatory-like domain
MSRFSRLTLFTLLAAPSVWAQFGSGFQGTVVDRTAGALPNVVLRVTNIDTGISREVVANAEGYYTVPSLSPGNYKIEAAKPGFITAVQDSLVLPSDQVRKVDFTLDVGTVRESVNVSGQATVLETETGHITTQMDQAALGGLPVVNNSVFNLMVLQPGVTGRSMGVDNVSGRSTANVNFAGARVDSNSYSMDGMTVNSISRGGAAEVAPNVESVEQVAVQLSDANSSEGRNMGAHVNIVSKAGTNQFHGSGWDYLQNNDLNARNFFSLTPTTPLHRNQFGATAGGPIIKNHYCPRQV